MSDVVSILQFDPDEGLIEPARVIKPIAIAQACVICFFSEVFASLLQQGRLRHVTNQRSEIGEHPVYEIEMGSRRAAVFHPGVGAPLAACLLDEVIALGCRKFIVCGGAGVLDRTITLGHVVIPTSAVRDEGTSYHYLPPDRAAVAHPAAVAALERVLQARQVRYLKGKSWTTDALYRETRGKIRARRADGCLTVEMEAAALFAVAEFRCVVLGQLLYGGDDVSGADWDSRHWDKSTTVRERLFWLAVEAALEIE